MNVGFDSSIRASRMPMAGSVSLQNTQWQFSRLDEGDISAPTLRVTERRADAIAARIEDLLKDESPRIGCSMAKK